MPPISPFAPLDEAIYARRKALRQRMRIIAAGSVFLFACLGALCFEAYVAHGIWTALGLFIMGSVFLFEAVRQADRRFVAPLQAHCQNDYNREVELVLGPLLSAHRRPVAAAPSAVFAQRIDA